MLEKQNQEYQDITLIKMKNSFTNSLFNCSLTMTQVLFNFLWFQFYLIRDHVRYGLRCCQRCLGAIREVKFVMTERRINNSLKNTHRHISYYTYKARNSFV
jgi:hypothetical protein